MHMPTFAGQNHPMAPLPSIRRVFERTAPGLVCLLVGLFCGGVRVAAMAGEAPLLGWETLSRLDRLPEFKPPVEIGCVSSYDRSGGNDDGFSGKYSFVRKEGDALVLADLEGPGVIYRIWTPTPTGDLLEFYFDGESEPRIRTRFREMFLGRTEPFIAPLAGYGAGGFFSYAPLAYARSCKIIARAERIQFYQVNYARYAPGTAIESYAASTEASVKARTVLSSSGQDLTRFTAPPAAPIETTRQKVAVPAGGQALLFERKQPGRIVGLRIRPLEALAGKSRDLLLKISFDGAAPAVLCPIGDFFGYAWGSPAMRSLLIGSTAREAYCYFPMPFEREARIEIVSERTGGPPVDLEAEVAVSAVGRRPDEGRFYALWRRENPTRPGQPFTFLETKGKGHLVGFVLQSQGFESGKTLFFEGDDQTWIDGRLAVHGTGTEDFFNGGWYDVPDRWEKRLSFPLSGCLGYDKHLGRTGGYRLLLGDAYSFSQSVLQTIEHSGTDNDIPTDYSGMTYLYSAEPPSADLSPGPAGKRQVVDLKEIMFAAWWQIPIRAFPFQDATLTRKLLKLTDGDVRFLSFRGGAPDWVGPPYLFVTCHLPAAGQYAVAVEALLGPEQGCVQLFQNEVPVSDAVDLYAAAAKKSARLELGTLALEEGDNPIMLKLVGKNKEATALGLDLINLILTRIE